MVFSTLYFQNKSEQKVTFSYQFLYTGLPQDTTRLSGGFHRAAMTETEGGLGKIHS